MRTIFLFLALSLYTLCSIAQSFNKKFTRSSNQPFTLDNSFNPQYEFLDGTIQVSGVTGIVQNSDGTLIAYGAFNPTLYPNYYKVVKFLPNGQIDQNFQIYNTIFPGPSGEVSYMVPIDNGFILNESNFKLRKVDTLGNKIDTNWHNNIDQALTIDVYEPYVYLDEKILMPCFQCQAPIVNPTYFFNLARITSIGEYDTTFNHDVNGIITGIKPYNDTSLLLFGNFTNYDTTYTPVVCRIDTSGKLDTNWVNVFQNGKPIDIFVQSDGKIIVMGWDLILQNSTDSLCMVRLNSDGSLDSTFNNFNNFKNQVGSINTACRTTDSGYLFGGWFNQFEGMLRKNIVKTDSNGFVDIQFFNGVAIDSIDPISANLGIPPIVGHIEKSIMGDAYYVMGNFLKYGNEVVKPIIRLHGLTVGMDDDELSNEEIKIFPNPNSGSFQINYTPVPEHLTLQVFNILGKEVHSQLLPLWSQLQNISIPKLSAGVYLATIKSSTTSKSLKFVVE